MSAYVRSRPISRTEWLMMMMMIKRKICLNWYTIFSHFKKCGREGTRYFVESQVEIRYYSFLSHKYGSMPKFCLRTDFWASCNVSTFKSYYSLATWFNISMSDCRITIDSLLFKQKSFGLLVRCSCFVTNILNIMTTDHF